MRVLMLAFFFFQAEDGIRAVAVTGVQTCALPILEQESFDGKNHLWLALEGDARETVPTLSGSIVTVRRPAGGPVRLTVRVTTDAPALVPLGRAEIFNEDFQRFAAQVRADTAHPLTSRRLEREVRGVELLCYREKLMAGLRSEERRVGKEWRCRWGACRDDEYEKEGG